MADLKGLFSCINLQFLNLNLTLELTMVFFLKKSFQSNIFSKYFLGRRKREIIVNITDARVKLSYSGFGSWFKSFGADSLVF